MTVPEQFSELLPKTAKDKRPFSYLWVFDPDTAHVTLEKQRSDHPADSPIHRDMAPHVTHPDRAHGWAIAIHDGWRIFNDDMQEPDPYIMDKIERALKGVHPPGPLPNIKYHG